MRGQADWIRSVKSGGCLACHQLGNQATREIPRELGEFPTSVAAWERRVQSGQAGAQMAGALNQFGRERILSEFASWTDRIRGGELPPAPPRPQGAERNVVITWWDWADPKVYLHDVVSTDRRNPTVNARGPLYGALELSADYLPVLDPVKHVASAVELTVRDPNTPATSPNMPHPRRTGAARRSGRARTTSTTRCSTNRAACGSPRRSGPSTTRITARPDRRTRPRSSRRLIARPGISRCTTRRRVSSRTSAPVSARTT